MNSQETDAKHRLFLIDIMRVLCALQIYMKHSGTMYGCHYGYTIDQLIGSLTSPVMTCFFILSGFSIHYQHISDAISSEWMRKYLTKRLISIMPSYLLVVLIWPLVYPAQVKDWVLLLPVDLFGIQTSYRTLFGILHNGGTWFVSCMLLCYVSYPVIKAVLGSPKKRTPIVMAVITHFLLMYSNVIIPRFTLESLYSNPIARTAEFMIGAAFAEAAFVKKAAKENDAEAYETDKITRNKAVHAENWRGWSPLCIIVCLVIISVLLAMVNRVSGRLMVFGYLVIPGVLFFLLAASHLRLVKLENSKILSALSGMSYQFFLTQLFLWNLTSWLIGVLHINDGNVQRIGLSFILCALISFVVWRFYDRPVRKALARRLL